SPSSSRTSFSAVRMSGATKLFITACLNQSRCLRHSSADRRFDRDLLVVGYFGVRQYRDVAVDVARESRQHRAQRRRHQQYRRLAGHLLLLRRIADRVLQAFGQAGLEGDVIDTCLSSAALERLEQQL